VTLATPLTYTVEEGRIFSPDLDLTIGRDGCVRGRVSVGMVVLCQSGSPPPALTAGGRVEQWVGASGNFTLELMDSGSSLRMDGYLRPGAAWELAMQATLLMGRGPQWEELRRNPVLLAIAAAMAGVRGEPLQNSR
jgi:hypothetical protein